MLGTVEYMAPEQARDAGTVDIRADIYGLGGTLYWCLTGRSPFSATDTLAQDLLHRLTQSPPSALAVRPEIPLALDAVVSRMMAPEPGDRYSTPEAVMRALLPFLGSRASSPSRRPSRAVEIALPGVPARSAVHHVLVVDDDPALSSFCRYLLEIGRAHV